MSLADQINQIRKLASQGKTETEIAAAVGVEMGDVATVLAGTMAGGGSGSGPNTLTTGADPGSTQGAAVLYLDISTPQSA